MKNYWLDKKKEPQFKLVTFSAVGKRKPKCEERWKRLESMSSSCFLIMKDDALDKCENGPEKVSIAE